MQKSNYLIKRADKIVYEFNFQELRFRSICIIPVNQSSEINQTLESIRNRGGNNSFDILFEKNNPENSTVKLY